MLGRNKIDVVDFELREREISSIRLATGMSQQSGKYGALVLISQRASVDVDAFG